MKVTTPHPKWIWFAGILLPGLILLLFCPGYQFSGLCFLGASCLIPLYHLIGLLPNVKWKRGITMFLSISLVLLCALMAVTMAFIVKSSRGTKEPTSEYLIVLGAGVNGTVPSRSLQERIDRAHDYLTKHPDAIAVVSGGQGPGEEISEAQCMFDALTAAGIDPDRVWMEDQATKTLENLEYSLDLIEGKTGTRPDQVAIVSSEYHLHRASIFAGWLDLEAELVPAKTVMPLLRWNYYLREIFAVWYYVFLGGVRI